jgi:hypothetical protein
MNKPLSNRNNNANKPETLRKRMKGSLLSNYEIIGNKS